MSVQQPAYVILFKSSVIYTSVGAGSTTSIKTSSIDESSGYYNGWTLTFTSGVNVGVSRTISNYVITGGPAIATFTTSAFPSAYTTGDTFTVNGTRHIFSSGGLHKISSASIKPGMTSTIGSFELKVPDISGSLATPGYFKDVLPFEDVEIWAGYGSDTGSKPIIAGKIETITSALSLGEGYTRTFLGSDYAECLRRVLINQSFPNSTGNTIIQTLRNYCTGSTTGNLSSSNAQIANDTSVYGNFIYENQNVLSALKEYADKSNKDTKIDSDKIMHSFERQSITGTEQFILGSNLLDFSVTKDLDSVKNDVYVFGIRDSRNISGSDIPVNHDDWTENVLTGWEGWITDSSAPPDFDNVCDVTYTNTDAPATGSYDIYVRSGSVSPGFTNGFYIYLTKTLPNSVMLTNGDFIHFYLAPLVEAPSPDTDPKNLPSVYLHTNAYTDYYTCMLDWRKDSWDPLTPKYFEYTINTGVDNEGTTTTGSVDVQEGFYKWQKVGNPDWSNINYISFDTYGPPLPLSNYYTNAMIYVDGVYLGTKYQAHGSGSSSIQKYGLRKSYVQSDIYNSTDYCINVMSTITGSSLEPLTQVSLTTSGSRNLALGSRYLTQISTDNISDYLELIDLEHTIDGSGFNSKCVLTDRKEIRTIIPTLQNPFMTTDNLTVWQIIGNLINGFKTKLENLYK